jgi:hypothetical protein
VARLFLFDLVWRAPRCRCVGKAWLPLAAILLTFAVTLIGVMLAASLLAHKSRSWLYEEIEVVLFKDRLRCLRTQE